MLINEECFFQRGFGNGTHRLAQKGEMVTFVSSLASRSRSITRVPDYQFRGVDLEDTALQGFKGNKHHYTCAFGNNRMLQGRVDAYVVDIAKYREEFNLPRSAE